MQGPVRPLRLEVVSVANYTEARSYTKTSAGAWSAAACDWANSARQAEINLAYNTHTSNLTRRCCAKLQLAHASVRTVFLHKSLLSGRRGAHLGSYIGTDGIVRRARRAA